MLHLVWMIKKKVDDLDVGELKTVPILSKKLKSKHKILQSVIIIR